eukprot:3896260-Pleurochrysis_carterae.AAC.1
MPAPQTTASDATRPMMEAITSLSRRQGASRTINPTTANASTARRSAKRLGHPTLAFRHRTPRDSFRLSTRGPIPRFATWRRGAK